MIKHFGKDLVRKRFIFTSSPASGEIDIGEIEANFGPPTRLFQLPLSTKGPSLLPVLWWVKAVDLQSNGNTQLYMGYEADESGSFPALPVIRAGLTSGSATNAFPVNNANEIVNYAWDPTATLSQYFGIITDVGAMMTGRLEITIWFIRTGL